MEDITAIFSARLRERRRILGMTQKQLAEKLGYSEKAISKWESGVGMPPSILLPRLSSLLEISIDALLSNPEEIRYFLGIDGGGTKTEFVLADRSGTVHKRTVLGPSNPNDIGMIPALEVLNTGILETCGDISRRAISVFAGIAGGITGDNRQRIAEALTRYRFGKVQNGSDAENAVAASLGRQNGVTVIMGTGAIAFAQYQGSLHRIGGFGYLFGDGGSGFSIGRDAIHAALKDEMGYGDKTLLTSLVREKCGGETILERLSDFYTDGKRTVASYAPLAFEALEAGDAVAKRILRENMSAIAELIHAASAHITDESTVRVALCGGVTRYRETVLSLIYEALGANRSKYKVEICTKPPVYGALLLAGMEKNSYAENGNKK